MNLNSHYWNARYLQDNTGWDLGEISPPLKNYINTLKDKSLKILIPGAGNAYEAEYLFNLGFRNVYVIDLAEEPLKNLKKRVPHFPENQLIHLDFFDYNDSFDLILEQTFFCALPVEQRNNYAIKMHFLLKPGGKLAGVLFNKKFDKDGPPFGGNKEEYLNYFEPLFLIEVLEPCYNSIAPRQGSEMFFIFKKN